MKTLNEDTSFKVSLKTLGGIAVGIATVVGMWFALQADIEEAKELPKNEWVEEWDAKVDERIPEPDVTRMEFDMKDQMVRQTIMTTQEDVKEIRELYVDLSLKENLEAIVELRFKEVSSDKSKQIENLLDLMKLTDKANTKSKFLSNGIDSTVHKKYFAFIGIIFSSPVINATLSVFTFFITLS